MWLFTLSVFFNKNIDEASVYNLHIIVILIIHDQIQLSNI